MIDSRHHTAEDFLIRETRRVYARYQDEFVEALILCPWAKRARSDGHVEVRVDLQEEFDHDPVLALIDEFTANPSVEVGLILFPRLAVSREQFEHWVAEAVARDAKRMGLDSPAFALAAFHPRARPDATKAERLVPFVRRTPDPTIQLVRLSALERVRKGDIGGTQYLDLNAFDLSRPEIITSLFGGSQESLRERISNANLQALENLGLSRATALLDDIASDRERVHQAYQKLRNEGAREIPLPKARGGCS